MSSRRRTSSRSRHGRHGRLGRSAVTRPPLIAPDNRIDRFEVIVASAVEYVRGAWADLQNVRFEIAAMPLLPSAKVDGPWPADSSYSAVGHRHEAVPRWYLDRQGDRIVLFRLPIERLLPPGHDDLLHRRVATEAAVFRAAAEWAGREPWDLGGER